MRRILALLMALLLLPALPAHASGDAPAPLDAQGPDAEGAYLLSYLVRRGAAGPASLALDVRREDGDGVAATARDVGTRELAAGESRVDLPFLPVEGPGDYAVSLVLDGLAGAPLRFAVDNGGGGDARFSFMVPDEPTELALTADAVNGEGKVKSPGEPVVTRATLRDGNGLSGLDGVRYVVETEGRAVDAGSLAFDANGTSAALESRWARSPAPAGPYVMTLLALRGGVPVANASRTFAVKDVAPALAGGNLTPALAGRAATLATEVLVADRNGAPGPGALEARVYKASVRMEGQGFRAELGAPAGRPDLDGHGRTAYPLRVSVPREAAAGLYRVSLYAGAAFVGSVPFDVRTAPTLADVRVEAEPGGGMRVVARGAGEGHLGLEAMGAAGAHVQAGASFAAGAGEVVLSLPEGASWTAPVRWTLTLRLAEGGEALETRNGTWSPDAGGPVLRLAPRHVSARLPAAWQVEAPGWDLAQADATVVLTRWDGAPATALAARLEGDVLRVSGPADVEPGRYDAVLRLAFPNGTRAETAWSFEAGPWMRLQVGAPVVQGREARIPLQNAGGLPLRRLVAEVAPEVAEAVLLVDGVEHEARPGVVGARRAFAGFDVPAGASAELVLRLPPGPLPAGAMDARVRLLALPGGAP
jgi:hypothetical protein